MRNRPLSLLLAFLLVPLLALACGGGDTDSADSEDAEVSETMEATPLEAAQGGEDPGHGEEGHEHVEGDEGEDPGHGEEGHEHVEGDEQPDTAATGN